MKIACLESLFERRKPKLRHVLCQVELTCATTKSMMPFGNPQVGSFDRLLATADVKLRFPLSMLD